MPTITEEDIRGTAEALVKAKDYVGIRTSVGTFYIMASAFLDTDLKPSVQSGFDAFIGLPDGHPLKKEFNPDYVRTGFERLSKLGFQPSRSYNELRRHLLSPL